MDGASLSFLLQSVFSWTLRISSSQAIWLSIPLALHPSGSLKLSLAGLWALGSGLWALGSGLWALGSGL